MEPRRVFLGWDRAVLPAAAAWLWEHVGSDMGRHLVAVPTARAGRRLVELLAEGAEPGNVLVPPRVETPGTLPEVLYESGGVVGALPALLARARSLRQADRELLRRVVPHPPAADDVAGWVGLAETFASLRDELAAARLTPGAVVRAAAAGGLDLGLSGPRWEAVAALEAAYEASLDGHDVQTARREALGAGRCGCDAPIVLVGLVDLPAQLAGMLAGAAEVTALVPAPEAHAAGFDAWGGLAAGYWAGRPVELGDVRFVDRPRDQAAGVVSALAGLPDAAAAADVCVGLGDESAGPAIGRALGLAGAAARTATGKLLRDSGPAVWLALLGRLAEGRRFADLAALVRHPAAGVWLGDDASWPDRLDRYASEFLQADAAGPWRGDAETRAAMRRLSERVDAWLPDRPAARRPLPAWAGAIGECLEAVYGQTPLRRDRDHDTVEALEAIGRGLRELASLDESDAATPAVAFGAAVALLLGRLADVRLPEPAGEPAVELVGFLELPWDDADYAVVTDANEGLLPASRMGDALLPDTLRRTLGMPDDARRLARDKLLLTIAAKSRRRLTVFVCRASAEGDPRVPSRLLLAGDRELKQRRLAAFYPEPDGHPEPPTPLLLTPGGESRFLIPRPLFDAPPIDTLRVTQFRDYLACPYRFYLKHVARLRVRDDRAAELDALAYGSLAHDVLEAFGRSDVADATDAETIEVFLHHTLDDTAKQKFGAAGSGVTSSGGRPAVRVQLAQLRERLSRFADRQAAETRAGWRIRQDLIELDLSAAVDLDGEPFTLTGRIDRIDQHPTHGFRLLDYKTSDAGDGPRKTHQRNRQWVDLQLPLYLTLSKGLGIDAAGLGYFNLPKDAERGGVKLAEWDSDEQADAWRAAEGVMRSVRAGRFWPPRQDVPRYPDGLERIAADAAPGRGELIARSGESSS
ncbi:MAG: PD-(D/E)XK nuclease family protein [Planctomycetota bacterium]